MLIARRGHQRKTAIRASLIARVPDDIDHVRPLRRCQRALRMPLLGDLPFQCIENSIVAVDTPTRQRQFLAAEPALLGDDQAALDPDHSASVDSHRCSLTGVCQATAADSNSTRSGRAELLTVTGPNGMVCPNRPELSTPPDLHTSCALSGGGHQWPSHAPSEPHRSWIKPTRTASDPTSVSRRPYRRFDGRDPATVNSGDEARLTAVYPLMASIPIHLSLKGVRNGGKPSSVSQCPDG